MALLVLVVVSAAILWVGYVTYGSWLSRFLGLHNGNATPANTKGDDVDYVPAGKWYLLGQHFSAISAAGPIVGPILAGMWFGWLPTLLWILIGGILVGGVHDMFTMAVSVRREGRSIAEVIRESMSRKAFVLFLLFLWFSLVYIITTFMDITAGTFADPVRGAGVASSSMMYLGLAVVMGLVLRIFKAPLTLTTLIFIPLVFLAIWLGPQCPLKIHPFPGLDIRMSWDVILLVYCFIAAVIPMWVLLQPRGYLGGFFLTFLTGLSVIGIVLGSLTQGFVMRYPALTGWVSPGGFPILPLLFTTVACGACSGFHALVASGTTSKQVSKETDIKLVGYGGLLLESFVAVIALATVVILSVSATQNLQDPNMIFAHGISLFLAKTGIPQELALNFALLAFATFVYDTLDVSTRLGRYIFEELTGWRGKWSPYAAAFITLVLPAIFVTSKTTDALGNVIPAWKMFWMVFGSSNQLLAALALLGVSLWLFKSGKNILVTLLPSLFMTLVAIASLFFILKPWFLEMISSGNFLWNPMAITAVGLFFLACFLFWEAFGILCKTKPQRPI